MKTLVTHNNRYHTDDVFACATLQLWLDKQNETYQVIRTRDEDIIATADFVFDVGSVYDSATNRYDHHQSEGAGERPSGIPYASFGLIWKHFGHSLCSSEEIFLEFDLKVVSGIDAVDNGISVTENLINDVRMIDVSDVLYTYLPSWKDSTTEAFDSGFEKAVQIAKEFIVSRLSVMSDAKEGEAIVEAAYQASPDKRLIILDRYCYGKDKLADHPEPLFVIFPDMNNRWMIIAVRDKDSEFVNRKDMPKEWGGLRNEEFARISGVADAVFCHKGLFLASAVSKEGTIELAKKSLLM